MHRNHLIAQLNAHHGIDTEEEEMRLRMLAFVQRAPDCFERSLQEGHLTGSAWIVDAARTQVVMVLHAKLDLWLQPGGHADGDTDLLQVAMKETAEETGLQVRPLETGIFDVDIHSIPARKQDPEHFHYDVRFLLEADPSAGLKISHESRKLTWIPLKSVQNYNSERSIMRLVEKTNSGKSAD